MNTKKTIRESRDYLLPSNHPVIRAITSKINQMSPFDDWYTSPYQDVFDNEGTDVHIEFSVSKVVLWKEDDTFKGTVYIKVEKILVGSEEEDMWERMYYIDDVPESVMETLTETLTDVLNLWIPNIEVDFTFKV